MKKTLRNCVSIFTLCFALVSTVSADNTIKYSNFNLENTSYMQEDVYVYYPDGTPIRTYVCDGFANIVTTEEIAWINLTFSDIETNSFTYISLISNDGIDTKATITHEDTDKIMSFEQYNISVLNQTIDFNDDIYFNTGSSFEISKAGCYLAEIITYENLEPVYSMFIVNPKAVETGTAFASDCNFYVNDKQLSLEAYVIKENNYFKLRDFAMILDGTDKQFDVDWDAENNAISLLSGQNYTAVGGELSKSDFNSKTYTSTTSTIYIDKISKTFDAYLIGENNYLKLRDICYFFDINVEWDQENQVVKIDTTKNYTQD